MSNKQLDFNFPKREPRDTTRSLTQNPLQFRLNVILDGVQALGEFTGASEQLRISTLNEVKDFIDGQIQQLKENETQRKKQNGKSKPIKPYEPEA